MYLQETQKQTHTTTTWGTSKMTTIEKVENIEEMNIYEKISNIQLNLLGHQFQTKKGYHGEFIPLKEMLPPVLKELRNYRLTLYFSATTDQFILKLMSWDNKEEFSARVRLPELTRDEKDEGKKITYLKRYLLMNVFQIIEDSIDPDADADETIENTVEQVTDSEHPKIIQELLEIYRNKYPNKTAEVHKLNGLRMNLFKSGEISKEDNREAIKYIKQYKEEHGIK